MTTRIIFAGSGGQGIQFSGKQMAKFGMHADKNVTFLPSYGPEMRGGTSNCSATPLSSTRSPRERTSRQFTSP